MILYLLNDKWTKTDLTDQIAKLHEFTFFHGVACESKHGWCVRHLKHHSNLSPTNARSMFIWNQPPYQSISYQSNTTSFEDSGLNLFYKSLSYKGFYFRDKLAHLSVSGQGEACRRWRCGRDRGGGGKWHDWCEVLKDDFGAFWNYRALFPCDSIKFARFCPLSRDVATETWGASNPVNLSNHSG